MVGRTDLAADLSDLARLSRLSEALPHAPIVSSDLRRAVDTAAAIRGGRLVLPPERALREFDYGDWDGRTFAEIDSPDLRAYFDDPGDRCAPNGESWNGVAARVEAVLDGLARDRGDLIVVAHMGVILTQWARATGLPPFRALAQRIDPLGLTRIDLRPGAAPVPIFANCHP